MLLPLLPAGGLTKSLFVGVLAGLQTYPAKTRHPSMHACCDDDEVADVSVCENRGSRRTNADSLQQDAADAANTSFCCSRECFFLDDVAIW